MYVGSAPHAKTMELYQHMNFAVYFGINDVLLRRTRRINWDTSYRYRMAAFAQGVIAFE